MKYIKHAYRTDIDKVRLTTLHVHSYPIPNCKNHTCQFKPCQSKICQLEVTVVSHGHTQTTRKRCGFTNNALKECRGLHNHLQTQWYSNRKVYTSSGRQAVSLTWMIRPYGLILSYLLTVHIQYRTESEMDSEPSLNVEICSAILAVACKYESAFGVTGTSTSCVGRQQIRPNFTEWNGTERNGTELRSKLNATTGKAGARL